MNSILINDLEVRFDVVPMHVLREIGRLINRFSQRQGVFYLWYRDVMIQAHQRGFVRIHGHSEELPFWWRSFADSVEIVSEDLKGIVAEGLVD